MDEPSAIQGRVVRVAFEADRHAASVLAEAYQHLRGGGGGSSPPQDSVQDHDAGHAAEWVLMEVDA